MPRLSVILAVWTGILLGLGTYTFQFAKGLSYLSNDPAACSNCHIMNDHFDSWLKSSHHGHAVCNDCHTPAAFPWKWITKAENGWNHSIKFTLQNFEEPIQIRPLNAEVLQRNCVLCHAELVHPVLEGGAAATTEELRCVRCHAGVGHGPRR